MMFINNLSIRIVIPEIWPHLKPIRILEYEEKRKIRIFWKEAFCPFHDLFFTIWHRFTGLEKKKLKFFIKYQFNA